ncbi:MAG: TerD family protein [Oscillospiraceae bacterium]|nr:TerD family protein [Oscillospiraceae bacterium]
MSINLQKGQRIDLTKGNAGLSEIMVGLGWDPVDQKGSLFHRVYQIDCDASVLLLNENGKLKDNRDVVYFGNLTHPSGSVNHMGDNLTGEGEGDDEQIKINLNKVPQYVSKLVFVVNIYDAFNRKQNFGMIRNAFIRIVDVRNNKEILKFSLTDDYSQFTDVFVGEVYRHDSEWKFTAIGQGSNYGSLRELVKKYY